MGGGGGGGGEGGPDPLVPLHDALKSNLVATPFDTSHLSNLLVHNS